MTLVDVSVGLAPSLPVWPESPGIELTPFKSRAKGDPANASVLRTDVHCGTHVDAPRHFVDSGATIDQIDLGVLNGPTYVAQVGGARIGAAELDRAEVPSDVRRLLLRTSNSADPSIYATPFREEYAALTPDGAAWVRDRGIEAVGIDYLSIQRFEDPPDAHEILLGAGVLIIEGLSLSAIVPGWFDMLCLPVLLTGAEAAPARVALRPLTPEA